MGVSVRHVRLLIFALLGTGLASSLYLVYINMNQTVCIPDQVCVYEDGLLYASLGSVWFIAGFVVNLIPRNRNIILVWAVSGFVGVLYFWRLMIIENYFCPYCFISHISGISAGALSIWITR